MLDPTIAAAIIVSMPAGVAAYASLRTRNDVKTNHGKKIGEHVEDLVYWSHMHQEQDNEIRTALGLDRVEYPVRDRS